MWADLDIVQPEVFHSGSPFRSTAPHGHPPNKGNKMLSPPADNNQNCPQPRAGWHATGQCGVLESAWSPDAQESPRGVHRRPHRLLLSLFFQWRCLQVIDISRSEEHTSE